MSCERFQNRILEYMDGCLPEKQERAMREHLADCESCQGALAREKHIGESLSTIMRNRADALMLNPWFGHKLASAMRQESESERARGFWSPLLRWSVTFGAAACIVTATLVHIGRENARIVVASPTTGAEPFIATSSTICVPEYTFRREGSMVVDSIAFRTNVIRLTALAAADSQIHLKSQEKKTL